jgi:polysaccharide export outer membrane protein
MTAPPMPPSTPERLLEYRLAPPDVLRITVRPEPVIERELTIRPDGRISFDLVGEVLVEGETVEEVRAAMTAALTRYIVSPTVTVTLTASNSRRYYVFGEVGNPGSFALIGRVTAVEALATAGGSTRFAAANSARLVRSSSETPLVYPVRFDDITQRGDSTTNYELRPGDVVYVPPSTSARIGYAIATFFFPLQAILGLAAPATRVVVNTE